MNAVPKQYLGNIREFRTFSYTKIEIIVFSIYEEWIIVSCTIEYFFSHHDSRMTERTISKEISSYHGIIGMIVSLRKSLSCCIYESDRTPDDSYIWVIHEKSELRFYTVFLTNIITIHTNDIWSLSLLYCSIESLADTEILSILEENNSFIPFCVCSNCDFRIIIWAIINDNKFEIRIWLTQYAFYRFRYIGLIVIYWHNNGHEWGTHSKHFSYLL